MKVRPLQDRILGSQAHIYVSKTGGIDETLMQGQLDFGVPHAERHDHVLAERCRQDDPVVEPEAAGDGGVAAVALAQPQAA